MAAWTEQLREGDAAVVNDGQRRLADRVVIGPATLALYPDESAIVLSLRVRTVDITLNNCLTNDGVLITVRMNGAFRIVENEQAIRTAAREFGDDSNYMRGRVTDALIREVRRQVTERRAAATEELAVLLPAEVGNRTRAQLTLLGLELVSLVVRDVRRPADAIHAEDLRETQDTGFAIELSSLHGVSQATVILAESLSLAAYVEPALLRTVRLTLHPDFSPSEESILWHSPLVFAAGAERLLLDPDVLPELRQQLATDPGRLSVAHDLVTQAHIAAPPFARLEEALTWSAVSGIGLSDTDGLFGAALAAMESGEQSGREVALWASTALPRLPAAVTASVAGWTLALAASERLGGRAVLAGTPPAAAADLAAESRSSSTRRDIGVRSTTVGVEVSDPPATDSYRLSVPDADPLVVIFHQPASLATKPTIAITGDLQPTQMNALAAFLSAHGLSVTAAPAPHDATIVIIDRVVRSSVSGWGESFIETIIPLYIDPDATALRDDVLRIRPDLADRPSIRVDADPVDATILLGQNPSFPIQLLDAIAPLLAEKAPSQTISVPRGETRFAAIHPPLWLRTPGSAWHVLRKSTIFVAVHGLDAEDLAISLRIALAGEMGEEGVRIGNPYDEEAETAVHVAGAKMVVALIGPGPLYDDTTTSRALETALQLGIPIVAILVGRAQPLVPADLPLTLSPLADLPTITHRAGDFDRTLQAVLTTARAAQARPERSHSNDDEVGSATAPPVGAIVLGARWVPLTEVTAGRRSVWLARPIDRPKERVVVKLRPGLDEAGNLREFRTLQREATKQANVLSPYVSPVLDIGLDDTHGAYLVTPHFPLGSVADRLRADGGSRPLGWCLQIIQDVLSGLVACVDHPRPIAHLDVKPANIVLQESGQACLIDFGLARYLSNQIEETAEPRGFSLWYSAPEQLFAEGRPGSAADVRAVAATLYELLTGSPPLVREAADAGLLDPGVAQVQPRIVDFIRSGKRAAHLSSLSTAIPGPISNLVAMWLDPVPEQRTPTGKSPYAVLDAADRFARVCADVRRAGEWATLVGPAVVDDSNDEPAASTITLDTVTLSL